MIGARFEVAFLGSFYDDPATLTWTDLTSRWDDAGGFDAKLGRDSNLAATPQAATSSFALTSNDAALMPGNTASPYWPNVVSGVPVRVSAKDATGTWWPVFYGLTESWDPNLDGDAPDWTLVTLTCSSAWTSLTQAGARRTYADRVVGDLAPAKGEVWAAGDAGGTNTDVLYVAGGVIYPGLPYGSGSMPWVNSIGPNAYEPGAGFQRFGFAWLKLDNTGGKTWATPGAASAGIETGGSDTSGLVSGNDSGHSPTAWDVMAGGFSGDRPGGQIVNRGDGTSGICAYPGGTLATQANYARMQTFVGRPPTQLAPVGVCAPTATTGWTASSGAVTLVASSTLAHLPRTTAYDPTTGVTAAAVVDGPANAISWAAPASGTLRTPNVPVTAGGWYGPVLITSGSITSVTIEWLNAGGTVLSTSSAIAIASPSGGWSTVGLGGRCFKAPTSAVNARLVVTNTSSAHTVTVAQVGVYAGEFTGQYDPSTAAGNEYYVAPARFWPIGADAHIYAWVRWPDLLSGGMTTGTAGQIRWLHAQIDVTTWDDGQLHLLAWNGWPGVGGLPVIWADNVRVTTGWSVSYPGVNIGSDIAHTLACSGSTMGGGFGAVGTFTVRVNTLNPSTLVVPAALLGAYRYEVTPDDVSIGRAWSFFGGRKSLSNTYASDTGAQITQTLDQLGWPDTLRDIGVGASNLALMWTDLSSLSDYSSAIGDLTKAEYGWVDIDASGKFRWLSRAWYGTGTATAVAHYTWRTPTAGQTAYVPPLDVRWDDKDTANSVVVSNGTDVMTRSRQDVAGQKRGLRRLAVTLPGGATQANIDAVADILAVVHAPGPRIESLTLRAVGPDDPMLAHILARRTGDVVLVDLPQLPAADLSVPMLVTSIEHTSDGVTWTTKLGLGVCPIRARDVVDGDTPTTVYSTIFDGGAPATVFTTILDGGTP